MSTEPAEDPVGHATSKVMQYTSFATMAAEVLHRRAEHRQAIAAAADQRGAAARRAETTADRNAARLQWRPVLDPRRSADLCLVDAGLAWAASQQWRGADAEADLASERAAARLRELRPDVMARFDRLTGEGLDPVEAMLRVAPFFDQPAAREHGAASRPSVTHLAADVDQAAAAHVSAGASRAGLEAVVLVASNRTQPQLAADGYPEPLTAAVLAAGKVKSKDPARTAPAAVRSNSLATAARAGKSRRNR